MFAVRKGGDRRRIVPAELTKSVDDQVRRHLERRDRPADPVAPPVVGDTDADQHLVMAGSAGRTTAHEGGVDPKVDRPRRRLGPGFP